jgi:hypothetical protein
MLYLFSFLLRSDDSNSLKENFWSKACSVSGSEKSIPDFLAPVFPKIITAGKSVELLQNLGRIDQVIQTARSGIDFVVEISILTFW